MKYNNSIFESIKEALNKSSASTGTFQNILRLEKNNTYVVRLLPNLKSTQNTFYHYFHHMWKSVITNQTVATLCPSTYGERCPIDEYRSKIYRTKDDAQIEDIRPISRNENWLVNVLVVKDPTNPENEGTVKILRCGKQLFKIINSAISGDDAEEFGAKVFSLGEDGCSLRIKVEENEGGYPSYVSSRFLSPGPLPFQVIEENIYDQVFTLEDVFEKKSYEEVKHLLDVHFLGNEHEQTTELSSENRHVEESVLRNSVETPSEDPINTIDPADITTSTGSDEKSASSKIDQDVEDILKNL